MCLGCGVKRWCASLSPEPPLLCFLSKPTLNCPPAPMVEDSSHKTQDSRTRFRYVSTTYVWFSLLCWRFSYDAGIYLLPWRRIKKLKTLYMCCVCSIPKRKRKRKQFSWPFTDTLSGRLFNFQRSSYLQSFSVIKHVLFVVCLTTPEGETYQIQWPLFQLLPTDQASAACWRPPLLQASLLVNNYASTSVADLELRENSRVNSATCSFNIGSLKRSMQKSPD